MKASHRSGTSTPQGRTGAPNGNRPSVVMVRSYRSLGLCVHHRLSGAAGVELTARTKQCAVAAWDDPLDMRDVFPGEQAPDEDPARLGWSGEPADDWERPPSLWDDGVDDLETHPTGRATQARPGLRVHFGSRLGLVALVAGLTAAVVGGVWLVGRQSGSPSEAGPQIPRATHTTPLVSSSTMSAAVSPTPSTAEATAETFTLPAQWSGEDWDPVEELMSLPGVSETTVRTNPPYERDAFGQAWLDVDRNGCDTRNDTLRRDLADLEVMSNTQGCVAYSGTLTDPYTGTSFSFLRGSGNAGELHVDHVVALSDAWRKGAHSWTPELRAEFANDPTNLVVTLGAVNMTKADQDAGTWLPPRPDAHCGFALQVVLVKSEYRLGIDESERDALRDALSTCTEGSSLLIRSEAE